MKRNAFVFILTALMVCSFGFANAADILDVSAMTGTWVDGPTYVAPGAVTWTIYLETDNKITGHTNGFRIFLSSDGTLGGEIAGTFGPMSAVALTDMGALGDDGGFFFTVR
mgnify:FL=1